MNRGLAALRAGGHEEALSNIDSALALDPRLAPALGARGIALGLLGRFAEALASLDAALAIDPSHAASWSNRGNALVEVGRSLEAVASYEHALRIDPGRAQTWQSLAAVLRRLDRHDEAIECLDRSLALVPGAPAAWSERGVTLREMGRQEEAFESFSRALNASPADAQARFNLGVLELLCGRMPQGWDGWEARQQLPPLATPRSSGALWDGSATLEGKRLLLLGEQGLGDSIQFCRYAPVLAARGARIVLSVQAPVLRLLQSLGGVESIVSNAGEQPAADYYCGLLSLPQRLRTTLEAIPGPRAYLAPSRSGVQAWAQRLGPRRALRVGLACSGNPLHAFDRHRSIPLAAFAPLAALGCELHLLQDRVVEGDVPWLARLGIADHREQLFDFAATAELAACMDLVVSVDTAVAHLAGALGLPLFLLLPFAPDWRWLLEREDSPWYPSARLFRQQAFARWDETLARLRDAVSERAG